MTGRQFTWAGAGGNPTYEKLGRVLASMEWELNAPWPRSKLETGTFQIILH
jgi:hypothetical protein